ncbi:MAG: UDP-N-acetylglucosamine 2-epimerase (non-hydrolyzing) [Bacteroidetes bacterium]|nr:UDP-N-acetylglucosamine 2-epimerase (non-hydrolyzing) [Bacteroidota bacterium]HET6243964.1 UDP-N-acetylglucosamine 2-epimerase (non-hydrolyzing) [Bacteroidia bacterium]
MKIITIIGARPQIIKAAALSRAISKASNKITEIIVHTGQHYDQNMSAVFFEELGIPQPKYNLNSGSGMHGEQTAKMIADIESILIKEKPSCIVLYGDTNSTLAGAIAASKILVPVVHIEAGLRSFNKKMPEEINRITCDHVSTLLFSPTKAGIKNLTKEGFDPKNNPPYTVDNPGVFHCGDIMYDNSIYFSMRANEKTNVISENKLKPNKYILATIHRNNNTDEPENLNALFAALNTISTSKKQQIILPLHPRTASLLEKHLDKDLYKSIKNNKDFKLISPVSFLEMIALEKNALLVITDSGGVQKEAYFFKKPCIILREETEWTELVENGCAILSGTDTEKIINAYDYLVEQNNFEFPEIFGDGNAAEFISETLISNFS